MSDIRFVVLNLLHSPPLVMRRALLSVLHGHVLPVKYSYRNLFRGTALYHSMCMCLREYAWCDLSVCACVFVCFECVCVF